MPSGYREKRRPKVLLLPPDGGDPGASVVIDLAITQEDMQDRPLHIARVHNPRKRGVDLYALKQRGLLGNLVKSV